MSDPASPSPVPPSRRRFIGQLAAAAVAGGASVSGGVSRADASPAPSPAPAPPRAPAAASDENDAWVARVTGKHKAVFDAPAIADGTVVTNAWVFLKSYGEVYALPDSDLSAVVVIRHAAIPLAFDDAMWAKYDFGKHAEVKDPGTKRWIRRNPYLTAAPGDEANAPYTLGALAGRGVILLGCDLAASRLSRGVAERTKQKAEDVKAELRAHLIPALTLVHSGIFAVTRAQEAGCTFVRST